MPNQNWDDPHRFETRVHYRLYRGRNNEPMVVCVQDFDYLDYDGDSFIGTEAWFNEADADEALRRLTSVAMPGMPKYVLVTEACQPGDFVEITLDPRTGMAVLKKA